MGILHQSGDSSFFSSFKRIWQAIRAANLSENQADYFLERLDADREAPHARDRDQALRAILDAICHIKAAHGLADQLRSPVSYCLLCL